MPEYKTVVIVADAHVGGAFGMMPRNFANNAGNIVGLNRGQEYLLKCYEHALAQVPDEIDLLVVNGDMVEGTNKAAAARGLSLVDPDYQGRAAVELFKPLAKRARNVRCNRGSGYHVGNMGELEEQVAKGLLAEPNGRGRYCRPWWLGKINGIEICAHHAISFTSRYHSMPIEREIGHALEYTGRTNDDMPDVFVTSHTHIGLLIWRDSDFLAIGTPPMKLQDDYAKANKFPWRWRPTKLGFVMLKIYDESHDGKRVDVVPFTYDHPAEGVEVIA